MNQDYIEIKGAKVHNLKNLSLKIPKNKLVVFTGVSGSGKSSLAFDTLYAEGQRRYVESLSSYARQFLGLMEKPDVESITGLSPAISIDQKTSGSNPRSTVGTVTEIYDYLRLLYTQIGETFCPNCGRPIKAQTIEEITNQILELIRKPNSKEEAKIQVLSPLIQDKKGTYQDLFQSLLSKGFLRVRVDGQVHNLDEAESIKLKKFAKHNIDLIIDRLVAPSPESIKSQDQEYLDFNKRLSDAIELSTNMAEGEVKIIINDSEYFFSENNTCFNCKISFPQIKPATFSFNSPHGACPKCAGLGTLNEINPELIYNPRLSILEGGIFPWSNMTTTDSWTLNVLKAVAKAHNFDLKTQLGQLPQSTLDLIFYGKEAHASYTVSFINKYGKAREYDAKFEGVIPQLERRYKETTSQYIREETEKYMVEKPCSECQGKRLKPYALAVKIKGQNIYEATNLQIKECLEFFKNLELKGVAKEIATPILREVETRLTFLANVGLDYLSLSRRANTLSGGESQRIRLASQIGTGLTGVLYVLDEPSIGLHSRDVSKLIDTLVELRDMGNSVVVVEHDYDTINRADWIVDIGPGAGEKGGELVGEGTLEDFKQTSGLTARYLKGDLKVGLDEEKGEEGEGGGGGEKEAEKIQRKFNLKRQNKDYKSIRIEGITTHNLKDVNLEIPLGKFVSITGVSGSGKSSLINDTLYPALMNHKMNGKQAEGEYKNIWGLEDIDKVIGIDQSPIGRTPRSNPATYTGLFNYIREIFEMTPEARARGYKSGRFSFNVKGGRCEKCRGEGQIRIEMQFLPDMYVTCEACQGKRYNKEALQIDFKGKNIADVLDMTVAEASEFFESIPTIKRKLELLEQVGLDYIKLGQSATTLSGGESQRIKLAKELSKSVRGHTVYILDEPTTGLHFHDVDKLLGVLKRLVDKGNTVVVVEHNLDIIKFADWIIDMGPDGGDEGGKIIFEGTVDEIVKKKESYTGEFLGKYLEEGN